MNISLDKQNLPTTGALILSVVILLASLAFAVFPKPDVDAQINSLKKKSSDAESQGQKIKNEVAAANLVSVSQTWAGTGDEIGPTAYANLNKLATERQVKIISFRPNRPVNAGDVTQLPYSVNVSGQYKNVLSFIRAIETTPSKLAVELLQLGSSDESSDGVTGTIGVEAYVLNAVADTSSTGTASSKSEKTEKSGKSSEAPKKGETPKKTATVGSATVITATLKPTKEGARGH